MILEGGGGQVVQAAGVGLLDPLLPLKHAQVAERLEEEELDRVDVGIGALGGSGSCSTPGSVSSSGKKGKGSSNMGLVSATDMDGREVTSGIKGLVTRLIEPQGLRRLSDPGRVAEYQGSRVDFKPAPGQYVCHTRCDIQRLEPCQPLAVDGPSPGSSRMSGIERRRQVQTFLGDGVLSSLAQRPLRVRLWPILYSFVWMRGSEHGN